MLDDIEQQLVVISKLEHDLSLISSEPKATRAVLDDTFDDGEDDGRPVDRRRRFHWAYKQALESDTQGYQTMTSTASSKSSDDDDGAMEVRTEQELTASSWAAFNTDLVHDAEDLVFRIRALDCSSLDERLRLGRALMRRKRANLSAKLKEVSTPGLNQTDPNEQ